MQVKQIMTGTVKSVDVDTTLRGVAEVMKQEDVGALPVMTGTHLSGLITDRDIVIRAIAEGHDIEKVNVRNVMTDAVVTCFDDDYVEEAARQMKENKIRRLVVLSREDKRPVGILSLGDIADHTEHIRLAGDVLERVTQE